MSIEIAARIASRFRRAIGDADEHQGLSETGTLGSAGISTARYSQETNAGNARFIARPLIGRLSAAIRVAYGVQVSIADDGTNPNPIRVKTAPAARRHAHPR